MKRTVIGRGIGREGRDEKDMLISDRPFKLFVNCAEIISKIWT